jgi:1-deoxy-D-xylulose-5-phosphate reductoisomerase
VPAAKRSEVTAIMMAIVVIAGLRPTMITIENKKIIHLASGQILTAAGKFITESTKQHNIQILPIETQHSGIFNVYGGRWRFC